VKKKKKSSCFFFPLLALRFPSFLRALSLVAFFLFVERRLRETKRREKNCVFCFPVKETSILASLLF